MEHLYSWNWGSFCGSQGSFCPSVSDKWQQDLLISLDPLRLWQWYGHYQCR